MRGRVALLIGMLTMLLSAGCHSCDNVERELRAREEEVRELREKLGSSEACNLALQNEVRLYRNEPPQADPNAPLGLTYPARTLTLARQTGGYDADGQPGDEALQVVLEPRDLDGHVVKVPGIVEIDAAEITEAGVKPAFSSWQVDAESLRRSWRSGLTTTGYFVVLPWKTPPQSPKLRVTARMLLPDGRILGADRDVTVRLIPQKPATPAKPTGPTLPFPMPLGGGGSTSGKPNDQALWWVVPRLETTSLRPASLPNAQGTSLIPTVAPVGLGPPQPAH
jgi:hypothetical protein